jgi:flagellar protein FliO/FliZ
MIKLFFAILLIAGHFAFAVEAELVAVSPTTVSANAKPNYNESDIPLSFGADKGVVLEKPGSSTKMLLGFVIVGLLLGAAVYFVRKYGNNKGSHSSLMQIKVTAQHYLGPKKSIAVIRVAGESLLIGITDHQINLIKGLSILDEEFTTTVTPNIFPKLNTNETDDLDVAVSTMNPEEDFSFADLKSTVAGKLKSARGFQ